jgi:FMN-dependent NADH-azoreductase
MKLLHIDSSITGDHSVSRTISAAAVEALKAAHPDIAVTYRDLAADPVPHLTLAALADPAIVDEFLAQDIILIGAPMYNFSLPSQLKAWIDRLAVAGKTFRYGPTGAEGLAGGRRVIVCMSRGGFYGPGQPAAAIEHAESYLRAFFGFIGITDVEFILAEGVMVGPEQRQAAVADALQAAAALSAQRLAA